MYVRSGVASEKPKEAHVLDVTRESFEDVCLLSELTTENSNKKVQRDSSHLHSHTKTMNAGAQILPVCRPIFLINALSQQYSGCYKGTVVEYNSAVSLLCPKNTNDNFTCDSFINIHSLFPTT